MYRRWLVVLLLGCILFSSCGTNSCPYCSDFIRTKAHEVGGGGNCPIPEVEVFIDGTFSMQGFVRAGTNTNFMRVAHPDNIERFLTEAFDRAITPEYFLFKDTLKDTIISVNDSIKRFPDDTLKMIKRDMLRKKTIIPNFFNGFANDYSYIFRRIKRQYEKGDTNKLYIIITDLFQTDNDVNKLIAIIDTIQSLHKTDMAIIGFRSKFKGFVYDIEIRGKKYSYTGSRNFFVVMIGRKCHIIKILNKMTATTKLGSYIVFSNDPIDSLILDTVQTVSVNRRKYRILKLSKKNICWRVKRLVDTLNLFLRWYSHNSSFMGKKLVVNSDILLDRKNGCNDIMKLIRSGMPVDAISDSLERTSAIKLLPSVDYKNRTIHLKVIFNLANIPPHCNQRGLAFIFNITTSDKGIPEWVKKWDMDILKVEQDKSELGKTYNLYNFVFQLYNIYSSRVIDKEVIYGCVQY